MQLARQRDDEGPWRNSIHWIFHSLFSPFCGRRPCNGCVSVWQRVLRWFLFIFCVFFLVRCSGEHIIASWKRIQSTDEHDERQNRHTDDFGALLFCLFFALNGLHCDHCCDLNLMIMALASVCVCRANGIGNGKAPMSNGDSYGVLLLAENQECNETNWLMYSVSACGQYNARVFNRRHLSRRQTCETGYWWKSVL